MVFFIIFIPVSAGTPTEFDLRTELHPVEHRWVEFGLKVGFKRATLSKYESDVSPMSLVVENWCRGNVEGGLSVSRESVVTALEQMNEHGLAAAIAAKRRRRSLKDPKMKELVPLCPQHKVWFLSKLSSASPLQGSLFLC